MLNKILVFGGLSVTAILIIENMVVANNAFVLWDVSKAYILATICTVVGFLIGYGFKGMSKSNNYDDDIDSMDF